MRFVLIQTYVQGTNLRIGEEGGGSHMKMFPGEGLATQQREFWIRGWAWRKTGARQVEQLLPSCPGTPVQGPGNLAPAQGGDFTLDTALPLWPSGAGYPVGTDKAFCKPAELPAASFSTSPHTIVYQLETI